MLWYYLDVFNADLVFQKRILVMRVASDIANRCRCLTDFSWLSCGATCFWVFSVLSGLWRDGFVLGFPVPLPWFCFLLLPLLSFSLFSSLALPWVASLSSPPLLFLFPRCSPSFSLCWFPLGLCEFFMYWQSQACFRLLWSPGSHGTITFAQKIFKLGIIPRPLSHSTSTKLFNGYIFGPFMIPPRPPPAPTWGQPGPTILLGQRWKSNLEFYDYQKVNGLPLPRLIQPSVWSQSMKIAGFDPLTLPLSRVLQNGSENFWLRILASGREVYLAPMGEVSHTQVAHNKATQEGLTLDDSAATQHFAKVMAAQLQAWIPSPQHEVQVQAKIAALQAELASLKANTIPTSPLCRRSIYSTWFQALTLERTILETIEKNIAAVDMVAGSTRGCYNKYSSSGYMLWSTLRENYFKSEWAPAENPESCSHFDFLA